QAPARPAGPPSGLPPLPPDHGAGERGRAEARAGPRGRRAARDERGRSGRRHAPPRGRGHAREPPRARGARGGGGGGPAPVLVQRPARGAPWGLPRAGPDGGRASERQGAAAPPPVGPATPQKSERQPLHGRPRRTRWGRRTRGCATTERRHDVVLGLVLTRSALGRPSSHGINSFETPSPTL